MRSEDPYSIFASPAKLQLQWFTASAYFAYRDAVRQRVLHKKWSRLAMHACCA